MARERSPNYPAYGLPVALQFAKQLWSQEKRTAVDLYSVARAIGSEGLSGPARSKIAAMRQYGLLQSVNADVKVSDRAVTLILQRPGQPEFDQAVKDAAVAPPLFAELRGDRPDASDESLHFYLVRHKQFSVDGATRVVKAYRETMAFAKLEDASYNDGGVDIEAAVDQPVDDTAKSDEPAKHPGGKQVSFTFALPRGVQAQVTFVGSEPTKRAVAKLRQYLELFEDDLPDDAVVQADPMALPDSALVP